MAETWRHFEEIARRALAFLNGNEQPITLTEKCDILKTAHSADTLVADVATTLGMGGSGLEQIVDEMDRLLNDPEIVAIYKNELWPEWFKTHETINGYDSFALRAEAGRIAAERREKKLDLSHQSPKKASHHLERGKCMAIARANCRVPSYSTEIVVV